MLSPGVIVLVIVAAFYGIWVAVVRAARRGERIGDRRLAQAAIDYSRGLHAAAEKALPFRWLVWDTAFGSVRNGVASCIYLVVLLLELFADMAEVVLENP